MDAKPVAAAAASTTDPRSLLGAEIDALFSRAQLPMAKAAETKIWVEEMGAVALEELGECVDEVCEALRLKPLEEARLRKALAAV